MRSAKANQSSATDLVRDPVVHLQLLLVCAVMLGGGGSHFPLRNLIVILLALVLLAMQYERVRLFFSHGPRLLKGLVLASLAIPLLQIVPLPPAIWQALPTGDLVLRSLEIAGVDAPAWRSLSVNPVRTLLAFSACIPAAAIISIGWTLSLAQRQQLARCIIITACIAMVLGAAQLASANSSFILFDDRIQDNVLYSTFANRNSTGLFMVIAILLAAGLPTPEHPVARWAPVSAIALLALATVLTQSRSAMVLLVVALIFVVVRFGWPKVGFRRSAAKWWLACAAAFAFVGFIGASSLTDGRVADSLQRFEVIESDRLEMWDDSAFIANAHLPFGTGIGSFNDVFEVHESLEYVSPRRAGRAHNDLLETAIEGGLVSLGLVGAWLFWTAYAGFQRGVRENYWPGLAAATGIACIAAQSLLDYPLRSQTMLCIAAVLIVLLATRSDERA